MTTKLEKIFGSFANARAYALSLGLVSEEELERWAAEDKAKRDKKYAAPRHLFSRVGRRLQWK